MGIREFKNSYLCLEKLRTIVPPCHAHSCRGFLSPHKMKEYSPAGMGKIPTHAIQHVLQATLSGVKEGSHN